MGCAGPAITVLRAAAARSMKLTFRALISNGARKVPIGNFEGRSLLHTFQ